MKTPKKKEVIKYFENAETIKTAIRVVKVNKKGFYFSNDVFWHKDKTGYNGIVWDSKDGYAKIISYKQPKEEMFTITKEQLESLYHHSHDLTKQQLKDLFPTVFKTELEDILNNGIESFIMQNCKGPNLIAIHTSFLKQLQENYLNFGNELPKGYSEYRGIRIIGSDDLRLDEIIIK